MIVNDDIAQHPILDFDFYKNTISKMLLTSTPKFTIGILGEWGSGKTTLMRMIENDLKDKKIGCVWFNAWRYEREKEYALFPLLRKISYSLQDKDQLSHEEPEFEGLVESIKNSFTGLINYKEEIISSVIGDLVKKYIGNDTGALIKNSILPAIKAIDETVEKETIYFNGIDKIEIEIEKIRKRDNKFRLIIFIDDLDRCSLDKTLETLESIKIFLDIPGFIYVIGLNHETISKLVNSKYKEGIINGDEYIKKIIQVPIPLPKWNKEDIIRLIENMKKNNELYPRFEDFIYHNKDLISDIIEHNPRDLKRFLSNFIMFCDLITDSNKNNKKIEIKSMLILKAINIKWINFYNFLVNADPSIRKKIYSYAKNKVDNSEEESLGIDFTNKMKEFHDDSLWEFVHKYEKLLSAIPNWETMRRILIPTLSMTEIRTTLKFFFDKEIEPFTVKVSDPGVSITYSDFEQLNILWSSRSIHRDHKISIVTVVEPTRRLTKAMFDTHTEHFKKHKIIKITMTRDDDNIEETIWPSR